MNRVKILHFIPGFLYGGVESLFMMWHDKIDPTKFEFELLLRTKDLEIDLLNEYSQRGGVYHRLRPFSPSHLLGYIGSVKRFFKEHNDYDVMHAHGGDPFVFYYAKKYGVKSIIYHSHTTSDGGSRYQLAKRLLRQYYDGVISHRMACSDLASEWLFAHRDDVLLLPNSVDIERFRYSSEVRRRYRDDLKLNNKKVVISVGRMTYAKNHPFILDIFELLLKKQSDYILLIIGDGPNYNMIDEMIKAKGLSGCVIMLGRRDDVPNLLQASDLFLMPSHYEGLPVTIVEAQASGLPALLSSKITKQVQITELVEYLSLDDTLEVWSDKIIEMVRRKRDRVEYYNKVSETDFNIDNSINKLSNIYSDCKENENIIS